MILVATLCSAATQGSFRGKIVRGPDADADKKWLYVQGLKGTIRRVEISDARVKYAPEVSKKDRKANPVEALGEGAQVQVDASQDGNGEWTASTVTILAVSTTTGQQRRSIL